jgi:glycosyltransferase involved in cell wall biosynthesis
VAFDTSVSREYLGEWGVYAPKGDAIALTEAILSLLEDEEHAQELGCRLRERAIERFSWEKAGRSIVELYEFCLAKPGRTRSKGV